MRFFLHLVLALIAAAAAAGPVSPEAMAEQRRQLEAAVEAQPQSVEALIELADWLRDHGDEEAALEPYGHALDLDPTQRRVEVMLRTVTRDLRVCADHIIEETPHFTVSHSGVGTERFLEACLLVLEQTRARIEREFGHWPTRRIEVVIYSQREFQHVVLAPDWAQAAFDGKIRVLLRPVQTYEERRAFQDTLSHELTHAFIYDLAGLRCPGWLNEGLAQRCETNFRLTERRRLELRRWHSEGLLTPIEDLPVDFAELRGLATAQRTYLASAALVEHLLRRFGAPRLGEVLADLGRGEPLETVIAQRLSIPLSELDRQWRAGL